MLVVVVGAVSPLLLGEGGAEVIFEVAPQRRNPRKSPAHLLLVVLELAQRSDQLTNERNVAAVQMGDNTVEMIGDQGASGASLALVGEPESIAEHEMIDEELRAPSEEVRQRGAALISLETILLVDANPRQLLSPPRQLVTSPCVLLLRLAARGALPATVRVFRSCGASSFFSFISGCPSSCLSRYEVPAISGGARNVRGEVGYLRQSTAYSGTSLIADCELNKRPVTRTGPGCATRGRSAE